MYSAKYINSDVGYSGIYRARLFIDKYNDVRAYIPGLHNVNPFDENDELKLEYYEYGTSFPKIQWCCYNVQSMDAVNINAVVWVMFESGNINRPVVISYSVIGGVGNLTSGFRPGTYTGTYQGGVYTGSGTTGSINGDYIFNKLIEAGASIGGACAVLGNLYVESKFDPSADNGTHYGIAQWDYNDRWVKLRTWCVNNGYANKEFTIEAQTAYLVYDLQTEATWMSKTNNEGWGYICTSITTEQEVTDLTDIIRLNYERCDEQGAQDRRDAAIVFWNSYKDGSIEDGKYKKDLDISDSGYAWPVPGHTYVSSGFKTKERPNHEGIDIVGETSGVIKNANIVATKDGIVRINQENPDGYGWWVAIEHDNGVYSRYGHMIAQSSIPVGTKVLQGDIIGNVGSSGSSSGFHLHFEIRPNNVPEDPLKYITVDGLSYR